MLERIGMLFMGMVLDFIFGDPHGIWHPVIGVGFVISKTEKILRRLLHIKEEREADIRKKQVAGVLLVLITLFICTAIPAVVFFLAEKLHPMLSLFLQGVLCYQLLAMKSLKDESMKVYQCLKNQDTEGARYAVSMIVGRDTKVLDEEGITKAAVETVAENTSDGVIAPLFYMILFGIYGGIVYKIVNTMDSMVGYKNDKYRYLGTCAAKLDDICNFIPSRLSALIMLLSGFFLRMDVKNGWKIFKRDRLCHASPNSAQTEAACAGLLGVRLAGDAWYFGVLHKKPYIGDALRGVEVEDIKRANQLLYMTGMITGGVGIIGLFIVSRFL